MKKLLVLGLMLSACTLGARSYTMDADEIDPVPTDINPTHDIGMTLKDTQSAMKKSQREMAANIHKMHRDQADKAARLAQMQGYRNEAATVREATRETNKKIVALKKRQEELLSYQQGLEKREQVLQKKINRLQYNKYGNN